MAVKQNESPAVNAGLPSIKESGFACLVTAIICCHWWIVVVVVVIVVVIIIVVVSIVSAGISISRRNWRIVGSIEALCTAGNGCYEQHDGACKN